VGRSVVICDEREAVCPVPTDEVTGVAAAAIATDPAVKTDAEIKKAALTAEIRLRLPVCMHLLSNHVGFSPNAQITNVSGCGRTTHESRKR